MAPQMTPGKRLAVRTALVTSTTLATIMGAQALMSIDETAISLPTPAVTESAAVTIPQAPSTGITAAAPNIVILRRGGDQPANTQGSAPTLQIVRPQTGVSAPPSPVVVAPPPVVQQIFPVTEESR